jgi:3',5'-cyclic AMP phosphodiesterase CpdA
MTASRRNVVARRLVLLGLVAVLALQPCFDGEGHAQVSASLTLPRKVGSLRFAVLGDSGRGDREQYEVAKQMVAFHKEFAYTFVIMLGDNIYGTDAPADMAEKFSTPYQPLLAAGVKFYASLGNHDNPNQRFYKAFNMGGERYYEFKTPATGIAVGEAGAQFFALDSNYLNKPQLDWLEKELAASKADWKISFFHHPLYSSARTHGSALESRAVLEPLFVKYGLSAVFAGHDHVYERTQPQTGGIVHWVSGAGGSLRKGDVRVSAMTAKKFDSDYHFMIVEISGDELYFQAISRTGATIDSGVVHRPGAVVAVAAPPPASAPVKVAAPAVATTARSTPEGETPEAPPSPPPSPTPTPKPSK